MYKTKIFFLPSKLINPTADDAIIYDCVIRRFRARRTRYLILAPDTIQTSSPDERRRPFDAIEDEVFQSTVKDGEDFIFFDGQRVFIFNKNLLSVLRTKN